MHQEFQNKLLGIIIKFIGEFVAKFMDGIIAPQIFTETNRFLIIFVIKFNTHFVLQFSSLELFSVFSAQNKLQKSTKISNAGFLYLKCSIALVSV